MAATTWNRESSQGLFDYDNSNVTKSTVKLETPSTLVRTGHIVCSAKECLSLPVRLAEVEVVDGHVCLSPCQSLPSEQTEKLWLAVKPLKTPNKIRGYRLAEGDVIKVGRVKFRVKELNSYTEQNLAHFSMDEMIHEESSESEDEQAEAQFELPCRVCLREDFEETNPLISPCNCGGTMKYIHLRCLQRCLKSKLVSRSSNATVSFGWRELNCDLCKKLFPYKVRIKQEVIELVEIPKPPGLYVVLEGLCNEKGGNRAIHVISMNAHNTIRIGRSNECELRLPEPSVSRLHATIKHVNGKYYVEDLKSKFGTLVQIKRPVPLDYYSPFVAQAGRSLLRFTYKQPWSLWPSCFKARNTPFDNLNRTIAAGGSLFPLSSGVPLSLPESSQALTQTNRKLSANLLCDHQQIGHNSSFEAEADVRDLEDVEVAVLASEAIDTLTIRERS